MVFTASLLGAQHNRDSVENKPASLFVESLDKAVNWMPPFSCGRQIVGPSSHPSWWPSLTEDSQTEPERTRNVYMYVYHHISKQVCCSGFEPGFYVNSVFDLSCLESLYLFSAFG